MALLVIGCFLSLFIIGCCFLLLVIVVCWLLFVVRYCCWLLLFVVILLLVIVVYCWLLLFVVGSAIDAVGYSAAISTCDKSCWPTALNLLRHVFMMLVCRQRFSLFVCLFVFVDAGGAGAGGRVASC